jgi:multiple sugar transport system ATP-binding protein
MTRVYVERLRKEFGDVVALDDVTLTFPDTELTVLVGPSGCGKTTLLRIIAGLEQATEGSVCIGEDDVSESPPWGRNTAMVFQSYALYPHMTVFKNIAFPLEARKISRAEIKERVERTAELLGIASLLERKPRALSGGQMQRVAIGRAIVRNPKVFLMDEPLSNLDAKLRVSMRAELKRLQKELGVTTIYVTHDQEEAMTIADQLVVMRRGRIQQIGRPEDVYFHPNNKYVAGFIGSPAINFLPCTYEREDGKLAAECFSYPAPTRVKEAMAEASAESLTLGIRPEDIQVDQEPSPGGIPVSVYMTEPMGKEILLTLEAQGRRIKALAPARLHPNLDVQLWMRFGEECIHLFDDETGEALI